MRAKRKGKAGDLPVLWRADFREVSSLPDTKAVRTGFLINSTALFLMSALLMVFSYNEYALWAAQGAVAEVEAEVEAGVPGNRGILFKGGEFRKLGRRAEEVFLFKEEPVDVAAFLRMLPLDVPEPMTLQRIEVDQLPGEGDADVATLVLTGTILPETAVGPSVLLERFQQDISDWEGFSRWELRTEIQSFGRNNTTGNFDFAIRFSLAAMEGGGG